MKNIRQPGKEIKISVTEKKIIDSYREKISKYFEEQSIENLDVEAIAKTPVVSKDQTKTLSH